MHDILLRNALIADPEADSLRTGDVAVEGGCIVEAIGSACTTIDCSGLVLQPGIIDTHVHLGINPLSYGMVARAGVTTALDMSGPIEKLLDEFSCANVGINVAALNAILPDRFSPRMRGCFWGLLFERHAAEVLPAYAGIFLPLKAWR